VGGLAGVFMMSIRVRLVEWMLVRSGRRHGRFIDCGFILLLGDAMSSPDLWRSEVLFSRFILVYILGSMGARLIPGGGQQIVLIMNHLIKPTGFPFGSFESLYSLGQPSVPFVLTRVAHIAPRVTGDNNSLGEVNTSFITSFGISSSSASGSWDSNSGVFLRALICS
jgi:hypothetical protein